MVWNLLLVVDSFRDRINGSDYHRYGTVKVTYTIAANCLSYSSFH